MHQRIPQLIALLLALVLLSRLELVRLLFVPGSTSGRLVIALFLALLLASLLGLLGRKTWGYYACYLLVPVATLLHGIALVPFITPWLPHASRPVAVLALNLAVLVLVVTAHARAARGRSPA